MSTAAVARLFVLGGASIEGDRGPIAGRAAQRRRLALLALLAANRRGMSRDKLIGYLWEEADTDRARRVLSEAIYVIRKSLGEDAVLTVGDEVRLNQVVVWSDVGAFLDALDAAQLQDAVALYRGPFLDGFFISEALEFDQWAERERDRLARAYARALQDIATRDEAAGDFRSAVVWWRRLVEHDQYGTAPTLGLMRALDATGDRAAAIREGRAHAGRMKAELDAEPDEQVEAFSASLRDSPTTASLPERVAGAPAARVPVPPSTATTAAIAPPPEPRATAAPAGSPRTRRKTLVYVSAGIASLAVMALAALLVRGNRQPVTTPTENSLIAVLPFTVHGEESQLRAGLAELMANNLDGAGEFRSVDPHSLLSRAERLGDDVDPVRAARFADDYGAKYFVLGNVLQTGAMLTLNASIYEVQSPGEPLAKATQQGLLDSVQLVLVDRLAQQLLAGIGTGPAQQLRRTAANTTASYPALRALWTGEEHFRAGNYDLAVRSFTTAITLDPQFAIAYYRLSAAAEWNFEFLKARRNARTALELSDRLQESDQRIVRAWYEFLNGNYEEAYRLYSSIRAQDHTNVEALSGMGEVLVHYNPLRGEPIAESERVFRNVLQLAPAYGEVRFHLLEQAARAKNRASFDSIFAGLPPRSPQRLAWAAVDAFTFGDANAQRRVLAEMDTASSMTLGIAAGRIAAHTHNFAGAARVAQKLLARAQSPEWQAGAHLLLAQIWLGAGDWTRVQESLQAAEPLERDWTRELSALFLLHPTARATRDQILAERARLETWDPGRHTPSSTFFFAAHYAVHSELRLYLLGLLSAAAGDLAAAERYRLELLRAVGDAETQQFASGLAHSLMGHMARARGDRAAAIELLLTTRITAPPELIALSPFYARAYDRFVLAELTGDPRWSRSLREGFDFVWTR
ncbi:MAG TPA: BTAD domain-containing putative transcriptional regulator [Longimicrobiales bacterium]|nr:BTAD domain-containing putative transcriptional regulator [Longimicrobiales bacterium]